MITKEIAVLITSTTLGIEYALVCKLHKSKNYVIPSNFVDHNKSDEDNACDIVKELTNNMLEINVNCFHKCHNVTIQINKSLIRKVFLIQVTNLDLLSLSMSNQEYDISFFDIKQCIDWFVKGNNEICELSIMPTNFKPRLTISINTIRTIKYLMDKNYFSFSKIIWPSIITVSSNRHQINLGQLTNPSINNHAQVKPVWVNPNIDDDDIFISS